MQYRFCPRCNFRLMAVKNLCPTCGHKFARTKQAKVCETEEKVQKGATGMLAKIWKLDFVSPSEKTGSA